MGQRYVLIMKGSPRPQGNSALLADRLADGAREAGAEVESVYVHDRQIRPCQACNHCARHDGRCVIRDDMQALYPKITRADALVIVSPIYWYAVSAQTKLWLDRCYALVMDPGGDRTAGKDFGAILTYAQPDVESSGAINVLGMLADIFERGILVGIVHGSAYRAGEIKQQPALFDQAYNLGRRLGANARR
jgi:multimeric flavodoxin WrbA